MNERIVRTDPTGSLEIIGLESAISELCRMGMYSEIAPRLRDGEPVRLPNGILYRAMATLSDEGAELLPPGAAN